MQKNRIIILAALLFVSGLSALTYQVVWLRELRLVFGSSTGAIGMVLAVFMAGLGIGAIFLGNISDRLKNPLAFYGFLEIGISIGAALSPLLIYLTRTIYLALGGSSTMGLPLATTLRVVLTGVILLLPTFLMGGTLPAAAKTVETVSDRGRRRLAILYGMNTLGGVLGVGLTTFFLLEMIGNQSTLWLASILNFLVGSLSIFWATRRDKLFPLFIGKEAVAVQENADNEFDLKKSNELGRYGIFAVYGAAFIAGFCFLLMELVWYRMLAPILGGSTFTFGLILSVALAGIGIGSGLFGTRDNQTRTTISAFATVCSLEALFMVIPFALGDRLAIFTALLKPLAAAGIYTQMFGWILVVAIVVLPGAIMSGIQFPLLIGLMGQGEKDVGAQTGHVYGWNTAGAIAGSLAGGFGLIPLLTAPGAWRFVMVLLLLLSLAAMAIAFRKSKAKFTHLPVIVGGIFIVLLLCRADGPSAAWRHSAIGATHYVELGAKTPNQIVDWQNEIRREVIWEAEGRESSVAIRAYDGLSFVVNGKPDGHAIGDAGTQVMGPLVGALLHPKPQRSMVIGLGTGSSAGWLAEVPSMKRVDVVEIEPAILEVARRCSPVNFNVLGHPKVNLIIGDGREILQTSREKYDVIFSEPSNPYRAGIASLYTREFYHSVASRLAPGGYFSQWLQSYYVDGRTIRTIITTLSTVFRRVDIWLTNDSDLLFVCSMGEDEPYSVPILKKKVGIEPFRSALRNAWGVEGVEGFLGAFLGRTGMSDEIAVQGVGQGLINTDDRTLAEFGFARTAGRTGLFSIDEFRLGIRGKNLHRPKLAGGFVDWFKVDDNFFNIMLWSGKKMTYGGGYSQEQMIRWKNLEAYLGGNFQSVIGVEKNGLMEKPSLLEQAMLAEALADIGDAKAVELDTRISELWPATGDGIMARYLWRIGEKEKAYELLVRALEGFRKDPWQIEGVVIHSLSLAMEMANKGFRGRELFSLLDKPFSVYMFEEYRKFVLVQVGKSIDYDHAARALSQWEPNVPWKKDILEFRLGCYQGIGSPLSDKAKKDLINFNEMEPQGVF